MSARRLNVLSHHQARQATRLDPLGRDDDEFGADSEVDYKRHRSEPILTRTTVHLRAD